MANLLLCVLCVSMLFAGQQLAGKALFDTSLVLMMASLGVSLREIWISIGALDLIRRQLSWPVSDIEGTQASSVAQPVSQG